MDHLHILTIPKVDMIMVTITNGLWGIGNHELKIYKQKI